MSWQWVAIIATLKILLAVWPKYANSKEFGFTQEQMNEVRSFAQVTACRTLLVSFPIASLLLILAYIDKYCPNAAILPITICGAAVSVVVILLMIYLPTALLRQPIMVPATLLVVVLGDFLIQVWLIREISQMLCRTALSAP